MNIEEEATKIAEKHKIPSCHSNFQIENFIIGKETSEIGKAWQILREINVRIENLKNAKEEIEETKDNLELANLDLEEETNKELNDLNEINLKKKEITLRKANRKINKIQAVLQKLQENKESIFQELEVFVNLFKKLSENGVIREFNDPEAQLEYWQQKLTAEVVISQFLGLPINPEVIKSCLAVPGTDEITKQIKNAYALATKKLTLKSN
jgi:DNA repair exonuclease SbcCD ATPase subunit